MPTYLRRIIVGLFALLVIVVMVGLVRDKVDYSAVITTLAGLMGAIVAASKLLHDTDRDDDDEEAR